MPGRPVISNCGVATEKISELLDFHLQPIVADLQHVIKDTNDFLRRLRPHLHETEVKPGPVRFSHSIIYNRCLHETGTKITQTSLKSYRLLNRTD